MSVDSPQLPAYKNGKANLDALRESHDVFNSIDFSRHQFAAGTLGDQSQNDSQSVFDSRQFDNSELRSSTSRDYI